MNTQQIIERAEKILSQPSVNVGSSICIHIGKEPGGVFRHTASAFVNGGDCVHSDSIDGLEQKIGNIDEWRRGQALARIEKLREEIAKCAEAIA